ncbi:MAG: integrating conjugative element protein [Gammaproteobacteria bacterium]|nr:integrating conjugative element protein [Gammaproteobacteria bacterium]
MQMLLLFIILVWPIRAEAEPPVLFDSGESVAIEKRPVMPRISPDSPLNMPAGNPDALIQKDKVLPVITPELSFGFVKKRRVNFPDLKAPVCVIGSDDRSLAWLVDYHAQLVAIAARCILVQAQTQADLERVARFAAGIPVLPVSGGELAQHFGIKHYPVLISKQWIEQ